MQEDGKGIGSKLPHLALRICGLVGSGSRSARARTEEGCSCKQLVPEYTEAEGGALLGERGSELVGG